MITFKQYLTEKVNKENFKPEFTAEKEILNGEYKLVASGGKFPDVDIPLLRISAQDKSGKEVGFVIFEVKNGFLWISKHLEAYKVVVQDAHRKKGIAQEMYKMAQELGNTVKPSNFQSDAGKALWKSMQKKKVI